MSIKTRQICDLVITHTPQWQHEIPVIKYIHNRNKWQKQWTENKK